MYVYIHIHIHIYICLPASKTFGDSASQHSQKAYGPAMARRHCRMQPVVFLRAAAGAETAKFNPPKWAIWGFPEMKGFPENYGKPGKP